MASESKLLLWEYEPGIADLTEHQQELIQDLAFLIERQPEHDLNAENSESSNAKVDAKNDPVCSSESSLPPELESSRKELMFLYDEAVSMKDSLSSADFHLQELLSTLKSVKGKTDALYRDCEDLVHSQQLLSSNADILHSKIEPLLEYDRLAVQLNAPNIIVTSATFLALLDKLETNLNYLAANPNFKEINVTKTRYNQLFSKAAALIRSEVEHSFQQAQNEVQIGSRNASENGKGEPEADAFSLLYSTFLQASSSSRGVLKNLDEKATKFPDHYGDLMQDSHKLFFSVRSKLLNPFINSTVADFRLSKKQNICELLRLVCSFLVRLCREEFRLYHQYFTQPSQSLLDFLFGVCQTFYDSVRPEIIHLDQVEKICYVCCFLSQEILREYRNDVTAELVPFVQFVHSLLADCRERLMFRVNNFIDSEIVGYVPGRGDLAYPEKLEILFHLVQAAKEESRGRISSRASVSSFSSRGFEERYLFSTESQGFWYPTLKRAVGFLSKLYQSLDSHSFKIVAQEVVLRTVESLQRASAEISKSKGPIHGDLFLISHILVLREHLTLFQVDLSTEEQSLDFSKIYGAAKEMVVRKSSIFTLSSRNALLEFFVNAGPEVRTNTVDCRKELDANLRSVCLRLVEVVSRKIIGPLLDFVEKANVVLSIGNPGSAIGNPGSAIKLSNQAFAAPTEVKDVVAAVYRSIKNELPAVLGQFLLYLISVDTLYVLYKPIRIKIWNCLERFGKILTDGYSEEDRAIIGFPSLEQWHVMLNVSPLTPVTAKKNGANGTEAAVQHV